MARQRLPLVFLGAWPTTELAIATTRSTLSMMARWGADFWSELRTRLLRLRGVSQDSCKCLRAQGLINIPVQGFKLEVPPLGSPLPGVNRNRDPPCSSGINQAPASEKASKKAKREHVATLKCRDMRLLCLGAACRTPSTINFNMPWAGNTGKNTGVLPWMRCQIRSVGRHLRIVPQKASGLFGA